MRSYQKSTRNQDKNKSLFLIYTPFQLFSVLNIIDAIDENNEVHLVYMNDSIKKYTNTINQFYNVDILEYEFAFNQITKYKKRTIIYLNMIKKMIKWKKEMLCVRNSNIKYDKIFVPSDAIGCNVVFSHFYKLNKKISLNVFDDGIGTYKTGYLDAKNKIMYQKVSQIVFGCFFWKYIKSLYCYKPELIDNDIKISIKQIKMSNRVKNIISLDGDEKKYKNKKLIYLDQGISDEILNKFFELSKTYFKENEIISKVHPRLKSCIPESYSDIDSSGKAFESIYANLNEEKVLIVSSYSTACLTPYMIFDKYPYVIFLGMIKNSKLESVFESKYMKTIYKEYKPYRLFIPKTFDELESNLKFILSEINTKENKKNDNV